MFFKKSFLNEYYSFLNFKKSIFILVLSLSIIETFLSISGIALLYPLIHFLQYGVTEFLESSNQMIIFINELYAYFNVKISISNLIISAAIPLLCQQAIKYYTQIKIVNLQVTATCNAREKVIDHLINSSKDYFLNKKIGEIGNTMSIELSRMGLLLFYQLNIFVNIMSILILSFVLLFISYKMFVLIISVLLIVPFSIKKLTTLMRSIGTSNTSHYSFLQEVLYETIKNILKVRLSLQQDNEVVRFKKIGRKIDLNLRFIGMINAILNTLIEPIVFILVLFSIYMGVEVFQLDLSIIIVFIYTLYRLSSPLRQVFANYNQVNVYKASFYRVKELFEESSKNLFVQDGNIIIDSFQKDIRFKNVDFSFNEKTLFTNLTLSFIANTTTAIIGKSGAGKSTVLDLLLRIRKPINGEIIFGNDNLNSINLRSFYKNIGYISQEQFLFHGTIKDNITYGLSYKSDDDIERACQEAHIWDFIMSLDDGINTKIGEGGGKLSGGQKQRLQLAHLFLQDPDIILMDEPTSALDSESEKIIVNTLKELHMKKTIIIIAHRLSTIQHADKIIVLEGGCVIEEGNHSTLIGNESRYKEYFEMGES